MRTNALFAIALIAAGPVLSVGAAHAQDKSEACAQSAAVVSAAVEGRQAGQSKSAVRNALRDALDREAGDMLAEWIWSLPQEQLTPAIGEAFEAQCLAQ
ncbi:hypothetical protein GCM10011415_33090 [Salipiger pallidus]|uniref:HdeA/HdeB family protein n=1 Tax=Salipiger pallidus TaxID=1775170 RepID=A0A8J2ZM51_9RHOB|nr:hypothetical protein [Salipiger pallidus]GGG80990.1 hypothetical protein GCM10011415_33090 [Salipiger pallidus]